MNELVIDRKNFKQNRVAYGISQEEIANRCGLVSTTVSNYERFEGKYSQIRARDDNEKLMVRALYDIIQERINETFTNSIKKEDKVVGESKNLFYITYDRKAIGEKIYKYCLYSGINVTDFCKMCGVSANTFVSSKIEEKPQIRLQTINKILAATGWTLELLTGPNDIPVQPIQERIKEVIDSNALQKPVTNDLEPLRPNPIEADEDRKMSSLQHDGNVKITDERYTFQDGEYFYEYTIVRKVKRKISKEQFINDISKKEEK